MNLLKSMAGINLKLEKIRIMVKTKYMQFVFCLFFSLRFFLPGEAQEVSVNYAQFLQKVAESNDNFWIRVHAAEALSLNNFPVDAKRFFNRELNETGAKKIGALRVMARSQNGNSSKIDSISKAILSEFIVAENEHNRLVALETLGKLGLFIPDKRISTLAQTGEGGIKGMASWVMANSGNAKDLNALVDLLFSTDTLQFRYAAYSLRFIKNVTPEGFLKMKEISDTLNKSHPFRVYLISALYCHSPKEEINSFKDELLSYLNGQVFERYEVYEALTKRGGKEFIPVIEQGFRNEENEDVKVSASNAYLANEHYLQSQIVWIDWVIIVLYGLLLIGIGWYYSYRQKNKEDYYLGGRSVNPFFAGISLYVSFFSAITYLAIPGEVIKYGPLYALATVVGVPVIILVANYFLIPYFMNLKIQSAYEILEKPLGKRIRSIGSIIFIITRFLWMALLLFLASKAMVVMMGWSEDYIFTIILVLGLITVYYTSFGGLKAVLFTDVIQFFILLLGAVMTIGVVGVKFGGFSAVIPDSWTNNWAGVDFISFNPYVRLTIFFAIINNITWWLCTSGSDQMAIQRFLSTKDLKAARRTFIHSQSGMVVITLLLMFVGFAVMNFYKIHPNLLTSGRSVFSNADFLFPHFVSSQFPPGMSGLIIAALFSASMSSLSSGINSVGSIVTNDILPLLFGNYKNLDSLRNIRFISVFIGIVAVLLSLAIKFVPGNIVEVTSKTNGLFIAPLFNLFFMALFVKNAKPFGVFMGSVYGFLVALLIGFWDVFTGNPPFSFLWIAFSSLVVSIISSFLFNLIFKSVRGRRAMYWGIILVIPWLILFFMII